MGGDQNNKHIQIPHGLAHSDSWLHARRLCKTILRNERERRFSNSLGSDPGTQGNIAILCGVYAVCRRESSDSKYHQELLILSNSGSTNAPRCYCTYITLNSVTRGEWKLVGNIAHCALSGYQEENTQDVCGLYLAYSSGRDLLSGFLAGTGTEHGFPVAMPIVAARIDGPSESILQLGDLGDETILRAFRKIKPNLSSIAASLRQALEKKMEPLVSNPTEVFPQLRMAFEDGASAMVHPDIRAFCKSIVT